MKRKKTSRLLPVTFPTQRLPKAILLATLVMVFLATTSCTKRCRCIRYDTGLEYFTQEELSAQGKTCAEMRYMSGLATQRFSVCEWVYNE